MTLSACLLFIPKNFSLNFNKPHFPCKYTVTASSSIMNADTSILIILKAKNRMLQSITMFFAQVKMCKTIFVAFILIYKVLYLYWSIPTVHREFISLCIVYMCFFAIFIFTSSSFRLIVCCFFISLSTFILKCSVLSYALIVLTSTSLYSFFMLAACKKRYESIYHVIFISSLHSLICLAVGLF